MKLLSAISLAKILILFDLSHRRPHLLCPAAAFGRPPGPSALASGPANRHFTGQTSSKRASSPANRAFTGQTGSGRASGPANRTFTGQTGPKRASGPANRHFPGQMDSGRPGSAGGGLDQRDQQVEEVGDDAGGEACDGVGAEGFGDGLAEAEGVEHGGVG